MRLNNSSPTFSKEDIEREFNIILTDEEFENLNVGISERETPTKIQYKYPLLLLKLTTEVALEKLKEILKRSKSGEVVNFYFTTDGISVFYLGEYKITQNMFKALSILGFEAKYYLKKGTITNNIPIDVESFREKIIPYAEVPEEPENILTTVAEPVSKFQDDKLFIDNLLKSVEINQDITQELKILEEQVPASDIGNQNELNTFVNSFEIDSFENIIQNENTTEDFNQLVNDIMDGLNVKEGVEWT